jgi:anaerobic selenocysteine-containing dehydrogenase
MNKKGDLFCSTLIYLDDSHIGCYANELDAKKIPVSEGDLIEIITKKGAYFAKIKKLHVSYNMTDSNPANGVLSITIICKKEQHYSSFTSLQKDNEYKKLGIFSHQ